MKRIILAVLFILSVSQAKEKMVLLNIQMHGCIWCAKMQREVFDNPKVLVKLKKRFKVIVLNRDEDVGKIPSFLHPRYFPTTYILTPDMKKVDDELPGYMSAKQLFYYFDID
jgi:uncharacterized protein YyaL (SSP411 family)